MKTYIDSQDILKKNIRLILYNIFFRLYFKGKSDNS